VSIARFRLRGQHLDKRVPRSKLVDLVRDVAGLHAQLMTSAELEVWVRVKGAGREDLQRALWEDRTLAKTWLMRGTLHVVAAEDLAVFTAAVGARRVTTPYFLKRIGVTEKELDRVVDAIGEVLDGRVLTREQLAKEVERRLGTERKKRPEPAWAWFTRISAMRGVLCYGPNEGRSATFTRPSSWVADWRGWTHEDARTELLRRYLRAHGPAGPEDFAWWLDMGPVGRVRDAWSAVEDELQEAEPGRFIMSSDARRLRSRAAHDRVRLLPSFDPALLGHKDRSHIVDPDRYSTIYRKAAWVTPAVLVDGRIAGTWSHEIKSKRVHVTVEPFAKLDTEARELIAAEADSLGSFLGTPAEVRFA
jgi:Winged helix DNA-binding domain